ncbi:hypothetical protein TNCV_1890851 [Trichonephila clavipes]|nr:hypothetical protein TNCV_1890851 [Trichonephila clavipes]
MITTSNGQTLPAVLLGLRTALRPDTNHTIAQIIYGSNIRLPDEFFYPETFVATLQTFMKELKSTKSSPPRSQKIFVHKVLLSCICESRSCKESAGATIWWTIPSNKEK